MLKGTFTITNVASWKTFRGQFHQRPSNVIVKVSLKVFRWPSYSVFLLLLQVVLLPPSSLVEFLFLFPLSFSQCDLKIKPERCGHGHTQESGAISDRATDHMDAPQMGSAIRPHHGIH